MKQRGTIYLQLIAIIILLYSCGGCGGGGDSSSPPDNSATLTWNDNSESDLAGYKIYYGTSPRTGSDPKVCTMCGYSVKIDAKKVTVYTVRNLTGGSTYYFSVTAYDTSGNESAYSVKEVQKEFK